ncbi:MAG: CoA ester lyase [Dehalococcoidia bacterium]|nr:MAG: CoA ester lyase [Dehalococcoidia bacterium]
MEPLRTLLFVPGNRQNMIEKAQALPADVLVLDLEDSVPAAEKANARALVRDSIAGLALKGQRVFVRINSLASGYAQQDLEAVISDGIDGISQPKPSSGDEIRRVEAIIERLERDRGMRQGHVKLIPWVETAKGLLNAFEIASASPRVVGIAFGAEDFTLDTGMERTKEGSELHHPRVMVVIAARAADVIAIDTPYNDFRDEEGLIREARLARSLGFEGKFLIHPSQIDPVNQIFRPSAEEVAHARRVVEAFEAAEVQGFASTSLEGKMIDIPQANRARKLLGIAESIAQSEQG